MIDLKNYRTHVEKWGTLQGHYAKELFEEIERLQEMEKIGKERYGPAGWRLLEELKELRRIVGEVRKALAPNPFRVPLQPGEVFEFGPEEVVGEMRPAPQMPCRSECKTCGGLGSVDAERGNAEAPCPDCSPTGKAWKRLLRR